MRPPVPTTVPNALLAAAVAAAAGFVLGGLTSFAQGVLPDAIEPIANSSSGWTLLTVLVVLLLRRRAAPSALAAVVCFVTLVLGYQTVSTWRGFPDSEELFLVAGVVVGPFVGVATAWLRERGTRAALGAGLLGGIGAGDAVFGLAVVLDTTGPVYWVLIGAIGAALVALVCARSLDSARQRLLCVGVAAVVAALFVGAYTAAGSI